MIELKLYYILLLIIILILLLKYKECFCRCRKNGFSVGGDFGDWWDDNVRSTGAVQSLEGATEDMSHEYRTRVTNQGGLATTVETRSEVIAGDVSSGVVGSVRGVGMAIDAYEDGEMTRGMIDVGTALTDSERVVLNRFDHNCARGTSSDRQVCQILADIGFDTFIEKAGFIANMKRISDNAHDIIVHINIISDAKSTAQCTELFTTVEGILVSALLAVAPELLIGMELVISTIGVGIVAACGAIQLSNIPDEEKENMTYTLAGWIQYRLGPMISGSVNDIYIPEPENNYMTDIYDADVRKFVQFKLRFITENPEEARLMCDNSIDMCSGLSVGMSNARKSKIVFDAVKRLYMDSYLTPTPQRTKRKFMYATLAAAITFKIAESSEYDMNHCIATQQLLSCNNDHVFPPGGDYRHLANEYDNNMCNLYKKRENIPEDIPCCNKGWNTDISSIDTHVDENNITRNIFIKNDGSKCVSPPHYPDIQNHSIQTTKRVWNSSKNTYHTNNPQ